MPFTERWPQWVQPAPGGPADPLGESVLNPQQAWLRVFEPQDLRLVLGRNQDPERELHLAAAQAEGVPIHRRVTGGGAVVLSPGMLVVALRLPLDRPGTDLYFARINAPLADAVERQIGRRPDCRGHGDLTLPGADGGPRKVLGASLRQAGGQVYYLGVFLVADAVPLMQRYLRSPSREPEYRGGRGHAAFCTCLAKHGASLPPLRAGLEEELRRQLPSPATGWPASPISGCAGR